MYRNENIAIILNRFGMGFGDLSSSPDYEQELIIKVASRELTKQDFDELISLFPKKEKAKPAYRESGAMMIKNLTTGITQSAHVWSKVFSKGIYKAIRTKGTSFTFRGQKFEVQGV